VEHRGVGKPGGADSAGIRSKGSDSSHLKGPAEAVSKKKEEQSGMAGDRDTVSGANSSRAAFRPEPMAREERNGEAGVENKQEEVYSETANYGSDDSAGSYSFMFLYAAMMIFAMAILYAMPWIFILSLVAWIISLHFMRNFLDSRSNQTQVSYVLGSIAMRINKILTYAIYFLISIF
jgi:hypothetical protein